MSTSGEEHSQVKSSGNGSGEPIPDPGHEPRSKYAAPMLQITRTPVASHKQRSADGYQRGQSCRTTLEM